MALDKTLFSSIHPTAEQKAAMEQCRQVFKVCADQIDSIIPDGPDKDHVMRLIRDAAMWATQAIIRKPDGSPRA